MKHLKVQKVLLVLVVLLFAVGLATSSPVFAAMDRSTLSNSMASFVGDYNKAQAYSSNSVNSYPNNYGSGYHKGTGNGCGDKSEFTGASASSGQAAASSTVHVGYSFQYPLFISALVPGADTGGRPLKSDLSGAEEVPGPGDEDGWGSALITLNQGQGMVCWELFATDIVTPTAAHIHQAEFGVAGPVVVTLSPPVDGYSYGCTAVDADLIKEIRQNPSGFYVNVHNTDFPAGAIRGQLSK